MEVNKTVEINQENALETALRFTRQMLDVRSPEGMAPFIMVPKEMEREDLENLLPKPTRIRNTVAFQDLASFIAYVNLFKTPDSRIFSVRGSSAATMTACLDYHKAAAVPEPSWCGHSATYACPPSREWITWMEKNKFSFDQEGFSDFLETNMGDVQTPPGATLMELALTLAIKKDVSFASGIRLQDGASQFLYNENIETMGGKEGKLTLPDRFTLALAPFDGGQKYAVTARLRYRLNGRKLTFTYELLEVHRVMKDAFDGVRTETEKATSIPVWLGV
jgi:uncharacterized protein YfdQ (DUF2303 family)